MNDFVVVGTDTDAGKTSFSLLWLTAFESEFAYWKPLETGEFDSNKVRRLCSNTPVLSSLLQFTEPIAPSLAARRTNVSIPLAQELVRRKPSSPLPLLIETFGGPLSPLNETELQIELLRQFQLPCVLVANSSVGAIGRTLSCLKSMQLEGVVPRVVVLIGPIDTYAMEVIGQKTGLQVVSVPNPHDWSESGIRSTAMLAKAELQQIRHAIQKTRSVPNLVERDRATVWHPYTSLQDPLESLAVVSAEGEFLYLADGRKVIDAISSWWTILHGHRLPRLVKALHVATETLDHVIFGGVTHPAAIEVAEALLRTMPWGEGSRVFFSDNGSTAVEVALKMAYQWWVHRDQPQRTLFVGFENSYHGDTFGAMAVGRDPLFFGKFEPLLFKALQIPVSPIALEEALASHGEDVAAVIIEPLVQGAGGMQMHSPAILSELRGITERYGILFIVDEVMTAGRTGTWWAHSQANIVPDLVCTSKTLAGGMLPLSATLASPKIVREFNTSDRRKTLFHGHSFTANPLACAVAAENFRMLEEGNWLNDVDRIGKFWEHNALLFRELPNVIDVRHRGTIVAVELKDSGGYLASIGPRIKQFSIQNGVLLRPLGNVLYAMPPLKTAQESLEQILSVMIKAIRHLDEVP